MTGWTGRAPGRLDVMGGIADYSGALVLQLPLSCTTTVTIEAQDEPRVDVFTKRDGARRDVSVGLPLLTGVLREPAALRAWILERTGDLWPAYILGVVQWCLLHLDARRTTHGSRIRIESTVPEGAGVSSSAALEVATMRAMVASMGQEVPGEAMATACQWVENRVVGAPCGIMDQMTSACGRIDQLLRLRCQPAEVEGFIPVPDGFRFYGINSGVRHAVTGADYGTVRAAAFMGLKMISTMAGPDAARWGGYLANVTPGEFAGYEERLPEQMMGSDFLAQYGGTADSVTVVAPDRRYPVRPATRHPVFEQQRAVRFASLMESLPGEVGAAIEAGRLMRGSHDSYGACGLGSGATDRLVDLVDEAGPGRGVFGARITGGGSGGTVAILATEAAEDVVREIAARYRQETRRRASVMT